MKLLIGAYACNPYQGSEEAVGWEWVMALARAHRLTVLTASFHRKDIERAVGSSDNPRFIYVEPRWWDYHPIPFWKRIENSSFKPLMNLVYTAWQRRAFRTARALVHREHFDLVHQLTYVGYRFPGRLWKLDRPFVWGPIGGLENTPWRLLPALGLRGGVYYLGRNAVNTLQRKYLRSPLRALRAAGPGVIAATEGIAQALKSVYGVDSVVLSEVVVPRDLAVGEPPRRHPGQPLVLVWSGLHLPGKALNILLRALTRLTPETDWQLQILGDGPMRGRWEGEAHRLGIASRCHWRGRLPRAQALEVMGGAHVLAISSIKDLTSTVLLEGLTLGLPVICPDLCGFSGVVSDACGIKITASTIGGLVLGLAQAIEVLAKDETRRYRMGCAAQTRARDYTWEARARTLDEIYAATLAWHAECQSLRVDGDQHTDPDAG